MINHKPQRRFGFARPFQFSTSFSLLWFTDQKPLPDISDESSNARTLCENIGLLNIRELLPLMTRADNLLRILPSGTIQDFPVINWDGWLCS